MLGKVFTLFGRRQPAACFRLADILSGVDERIFNIVFILDHYSNRKEDSNQDRRNMTEGAILSIWAPGMVRRISLCIL